MALPEESGHHERCGAGGVREREGTTSDPVDVGATHEHTNHLASDVDHGRVECARSGHQCTQGVRGGVHQLH
jgi:hypothetical protein